MTWINLSSRLHARRTNEGPAAVLVRSEHVSAVRPVANPSGAVLFLTSGEKLEVGEIPSIVLALILAAEGP